MWIDEHYSIPRSGRSSYYAIELASGGECLSWRRTRKSSRRNSAKPKVSPSESTNSTSKTSGAKTSTIVPTCPAAKPHDPRSSSSATVSRSFAEGLDTESLYHVGGNQTRDLFSSANDPSGLDRGLLQATLNFDLNRKTNTKPGLLSHFAFFVPCGFQQ